METLNEIAIVGDLHIAPVPRNRIDDYFNVGLNKIEQIAKMNENVIFLGDIFSRPKVEEQYTNALIRHLKYCKGIYKTNFYAIIGNHDVQSELEEMLDNSSLGTLSVAECVAIIKPDHPIVIPGRDRKYRFNTIPVNFKKAKEFNINGKYGQQGYEDILLIHHEYETGTNCFHYNDFKDCNCKMIFFGHDHCPLPEGRIIYPEFTVYRSGSLMRNIAQDYNFTRQVYYYTINNGVVGCQAIQHKPANEVFTVESFTRENYHKKQFIEGIDNLIDKYKNNITKQDKFSMESILRGLNAPDSTIAYIKSKYESHGERFV